MAILEIKKFNNPALRKKSERVTEIGNDIKRIVDDMTETLEDRLEGVGLAAPQVGISKRIIIVKIDLNKPGFFILINPKITKKSKETEIGEEGCLSFPGIFLNIKRATKVEVEGLDTKGERITLEAEGFLARVLQHEIDHLYGILFFDRLPFFQKIKFQLKHGFN